MKCLVFLAILALASCQIDLKSFDWSTVKPLEEIQEWRDAHPRYEVLMKQQLGVHPSRSRRIINGEIATALEFPYMAGVLLHYDTGNSWCGGSLISINFVLTAANCVDVAPSASVLLGASNQHNIEANIRVQSINIHPGFDFSQSLNDIATLHLMWPAELSSTIGLVRLPNRRQVQSTFENQQGTVSGWGRTETAGTQAIPTQFLRFLRSPVITNLSCRIRFPNDIHASSVCTDPADGTPCTGDHGGPLMIVEADGRRTQIGVFSFHFSLGCGLGWPAVYSRVTSYLDFIEQNSDVRILDTWE